MTVKKLVSTAAGADDGLFRAGHSLVLKKPGRLAAYSLTPEDQIIFAEQPDLKSDPEAVAEWLSTPGFARDRDTPVRLADRVIEERPRRRDGEEHEKHALRPSSESDDDPNE